MIVDTYQIRIGGKQTDSTFAMIDMLIPPGGDPEPHAQAELMNLFSLFGRLK